MFDLEKCIAEIEFRFPCVRDHKFTCKEWQTLKSAVLAQQTTNNGSTPCRFFSRDKVCTGKAADGGNMYQSVPWCNHEPSQRAVP